MVYKYKNISLDLSEKVSGKIDFKCSPEFVARAVKAYIDYVDKVDNEDIKTMLSTMMIIAFDGCNVNFKQ